MSHTFKGTCSDNTQSSNGSHVAVLRGENGEEATIPSVDMLLVPGKQYSVTVDGEFAPKPKPVLVAQAPAKPVEQPKPAVAPVKA